MTSAGARPPRLLGGYRKLQSRCVLRTRSGRSSWIGQRHASPDVPVLERCVLAGAAGPPTAHAVRVELQSGIESALSGGCAHELVLGPPVTVSHS